MGTFLCGSFSELFENHAVLEFDGKIHACSDIFQGRGCNSRQDRRVHAWICNCHV